MKTTKVNNYLVEDLRPFLESLFERTGVDSEQAAVVVDAFLEANLRGVDTHGVRLIPVYLRRLERGGINPRPQVRIISDLGAALRIDGDNGLGQITGTYAMNTAIERARQYGVGFSVVGHTSHIGAASYYTRMPLKEGMAGFATSNNLPSLFVWGGLKRAVSNPPFSISFPTSVTPFVLDICLGTVAWNKVYMRLNDGENLPVGWAWDSSGRVTTDPRAASEGGSIIPIGGHKGASLALAVDLFTGVLGGFGFAEGVGALLTNDTEPEDSSCLMMAFNVDGILGPQTRQRAEHLVKWCKDSPLADGFEEILMPGEPEERIRAKRLETGIPILVEDAATFENLANKYKLESPFS